MTDVQNFETEIQSLEEEISQKKKELADLRKRMPERKVKDYVFKETDGENVSLSALFRDKNQLIVIHNMGQSCSYCTMWADGFNGVFGYVEEKAGFVLTSPDTPDEQKKIKAEIGWQFPMVSTEGTAFKKDLGFENEKGQLHPGASVFRKDAGGDIYHCNDVEFGPGDDFCSVWHFYDLLPSKDE